MVIYMLVAALVLCMIGFFYFKKGGKSNYPEVLLVGPNGSGKTLLYFLVKLN